MKKQKTVITTDLITREQVATEVSALSKAEKKMLGLTKSRPHTSLQTRLKLAETRAAKHRENVEDYLTGNA